MRIVITGCAGFIGSSVAIALHQAGHQVIGVTRQVGNSVAPFPVWAWKDDAETLSAYLVDVRADAVFHAAGSSSVAGSLVDPAADFRSSVVTLQLLLEAVRRSGLSPLVFFPSSAAVYGNPEVLPVVEDAPLKPISPYGYHKVMAEQLAFSYAASFGLRVVVLRLFSLLGPLQRRLLAWEIFQQVAEQRERVVLQGTGKETRDFLAVADVARVVAALVEIPATGLHVFNLGTGQETSVLQVADAIKAVLRSAAPVHCLGTARPGDPIRWRSSVARLQAILPTFEPTSFLTGLHTCLAAWTQRHSSVDCLAGQVD